MKKADIILKSNAIFDSIADAPFKGFVAISGDRIVASQQGDDFHDYLGPNTKLYSLGDRLVLPGLHDSHIHLSMAGMFKCHANFLDAKSEEEVCKSLYEFEKKAGNTKGEWIIGFSWYHVFWDDQTLPTKHSLDKYFPDSPVLLFNAELHGGWVNSKALEIAGVTKDTPDPIGGHFERDSNGEPTGFLYESALAYVGQYALDFPIESEKRYLKTFMDSAKELGITSVNDMQPYFGKNMGDLDAYKALEESNELTIRINVARNLLGDLDQVVEDGKKYDSEKIRINLLKQFLDGVPTTHTALVVDDYTDAPGNRGTSLSDLAEIEAAVPEGHKRNLSIRLHSCGDMSAKLALDYYENAINKYGKNQCRHGIEHLEFLDPPDIERIGKLGIIPSMQPEHIAITQTFEANPYPKVLGPIRAARTWPLKTMLTQAGVIAIGSDCPVVDNSPVLEIFRAVTRVHNDGKPEGGWNPSEKLTMAEVLRGYTYGGAYGVRREDDLGTLEPGKFADIVVYDRNLFDIDPWDILDAKVDITIMDGKVIFER